MPRLFPFLVPLLLVLPTRSHARCATDALNGTTCGGRGECWHASGPGRHWLAASTCACGRGYCSAVAKTVVGASGAAEPVHTCHACGTTDYTFEGYDSLAGNLTTLLGAAWGAGTHCAPGSFGPLSASASSSVATRSFVVGPDTEIEVTFGGGGGGGGGTGAALQAGTRPDRLPHPSAHGMLGLALADGGAYALATPGGGGYSTAGLVRRLSQAVLRPLRGRVVSLHLLSTYNAPTDALNWMCVGKVVLKSVLPP